MSLLRGVEVAPVYLVPSNSLSTSATSPVKHQGPRSSTWVVAIDDNFGTAKSGVVDGVLAVHSLRQRQGLLRGVEGAGVVPEAHASVADVYLVQGRVGGGTDVQGRVALGQVAVKDCPLARAKHAWHGTSLEVLSRMRGTV